MNIKSENRTSPAGKKQHALHCARERERWSHGVQQAREQQHQAEINSLRQQLVALTDERDAALERLRQAERQRQRLDDLHTQLAAAREQLQQVEALRQRLVEITSERDLARQQLQQEGSLQQQLADITLERDGARRQVDRLEKALARATTAAAASAAASVSHADRPAAAPERLVEEPRTQVEQAGMRHSYRAATAAGLVLTLGVMANVLIYHDAQSTVQPQSGLVDPENASFKALEPQLTEDGDGIRSADDDSQTTPPPQTRKPKTRFARSGEVRLQQWGPPLLLSADAGAEPTKGFDPVVQHQQQGLLALGFDIGKADGFSGPLTRQALYEFRSLYLSGLQKPPAGAALAAIIKNYADLAHSDARSFGVDQGVLAAIRLSSVRTGIEFSYLMKLAAVESNFDPVSKSSASSATGLYQFTRDTWLNTLKAHGDKYGLDSYVDKIDYVVDRNGYQRPVVRDKDVYRHLMALRNNPRVSAMMAAESVKDSVRRLTRSFDRKPTEADLYLTHFFGTDGAISFLKALDKTPDAPAVDIFPAAAQSNQDIFHPKTCRPRTVDEVYELFGQKFNNWRFEVATN